MNKQEILERIDEIRQNHEEAVAEARISGEEAFWKMCGHLMTIAELEKEVDTDE